MYIIKNKHGRDTNHKWRATVHIPDNIHLLESNYKTNRPTC